MSVPVHTLTLDDTLQPMGVQCKRITDAGEVAVDLTGSTMRFAMVDQFGVDVVTETASNVTVNDAVNGKVQYDFQSDDIDTVGEYWAWFIRDSGGEKEHFPIGRRLKVVVVAKEHS